MHNYIKFIGSTPTKKFKVLESGDNGSPLLVTDDDESASIIAVENSNDNARFVDPSNNSSTPTPVPDLS
jgi:hypothetical protein